MDPNQEHYSQQGHAFFSFLMRNKFHHEHYGLKPEMKPKVNFFFLKVRLLSTLDRSGVYPVRIELSIRWCTLMTYLALAFRTREEKNNLSRLLPNKDKSILRSE